jgi:hypothetical protein
LGSKSKDTETDDNAAMNENSGETETIHISTNTADDGITNTSHHFQDSVLSVIVPLVTMQLHLA